MNETVVNFWWAQVNCVWSRWGCRFRLQRVGTVQGLRKRDLVPVLGSPSRVTDVLARRRRLTLGMIRRAHEMLGLPLEILIQPYNLRNEEGD